MRFLFIVQGEGRGHLTQALAARSMLERAGHELAFVLAGSVRHRELPDFFVEKIGARIDRFGTPGFSIGKDHRSIRPLETLIDNVTRTPVFRRSLRLIDESIRRVRPDVVLTFYEPLSGVYQALYRPTVPFIAVGHQYMFDHPDYEFAPGRALDRRSLQMFTRLTSYRSAWKLALSFYPAPDLPDRRIAVIPPILREEALTYRHAQVAQEEFFLIYLLNRGYADHVIRWHKQHPERRLECFWDASDADEVVHYDDTLTFHRLHDTKFLDLMARCSGLVCTAGFESVSEAMLLGKPILAVPVEGHYEQACNAFEVEKLGVGRRGRTFDLNLLQEFRLSYHPRTDEFRTWFDTAEERVVEVLEAVGAGTEPPVRQSCLVEMPAR